MKIINILKESSLFKQSSIYLIADGISKAMPFFFLPIISYYITPSDYGILTNYNVLSQVLSVFCYSVTTVIIPVVYVKLCSEKLKDFISNLIILNVVTALVLTLLIVLFSSSISRYTSVSLNYQLLSVISVLFASFTQVNLVLWRCEEKPVYFGVVHVTQTAIDIGTAIVLIIFLGLGWQGRVISMVIANILIGGFSFGCLLNRGFVRVLFSKQDIITILSFSLPLLPHGLSFWIKSGADKLLLSNMVGLDSNALYSVAMTFGSIVSIFIVSFNNAFVPYLFKKLKIIDDRKDSVDNEINSLIRLYRWLLGGIFVFVFISYLLSYLVIYYIYQDSYNGALAFLPYIFVGQLFMGYYSLFVNFIHYTQKTKVLGAITFSLTLIQVFVSYLLIRLIGPIGSAVSSAITSLGIFVLVTKYAISVYELPWRQLFVFRLWRHV